jgi:4-hydroxy-tetrahydrodipicolinate reductase
MITVIVNGSRGKMGEEAVKAVKSDADLNLVAALDIQDSLFHSIQKTNAQVVVDLTHPSAVKQNVETIVKAGAYAVVGTTGLSDDDLKSIHQLALDCKVAVAVCPNFAIGAVLMMQLAKQVAPFFQRVEIIEYHHDKKADAPSGTAIKTADLIYEGNPKINQETLDQKELIKGVRGGQKHNIQIHSVRLPGIVANQDVIFGGLGQTLTLRHDTHHRECFMPGILLCIKKIKSYQGLIYGLEHFL